MVVVMVAMVLPVAVVGSAVEKRRGGGQAVVPEEVLLRMAAMVRVLLALHGVRGTRRRGRYGCGRVLRP